MPDTNEAPPSASLKDDEKRALEIEKLAVETKKLRNDNAVFWRSVAILAPVVTAFVAFFGVFISLYTLKQQGDDRSREAHEKAFQQALSMATDPTGGNDRRISGIYQIQRFWGNDREAEIVAATLASLVTLPDRLSEKNAIVINHATVRCAAVRAIASAFDPHISNSRTLDVPRILYGKAYSSPGLITQQNVALRADAEAAFQTEADTVPEKKADAALKEDASATSEKEADAILRTNADATLKADADTKAATIHSKNVKAIQNCETPLAATKAAIQVGLTVLRNTELSGADLSYLFLAKADFDGARLLNASLKGTTLLCANFSNADISFAEFDDAHATLTNTHETGISGEDLVISLGSVEKTPLTLPYEQWLRWQKSGFDGHVLEQVLGSDLPGWYRGKPDYIQAACARLY